MILNQETIANYVGRYFLGMTKASSRHDTQTQNVQRHNGNVGMKPLAYALLWPSIAGALQIQKVQDKLSSLCSELSVSLLQETFGSVIMEGRLVTQSFF